MSNRPQPNPDETQEKTRAGVRLSPEAEAAVKEVNDEIVIDIRRLATMYAKYDDVKTIDVKHINLARARLMNKNRTWYRPVGSLLNIIGGAFLGFLITVVLDATQTSVTTIPGGIALGVITVVLIVVGIIFSEQ